MNKKFVIIVLMILVIFLLIGCSNVNTSTTDDEALENQKNIEGEDAKEEIDTTRTGIQEVIHNEVAIEEAVWSDDEKMVCFSRLIEENDYELYVWEVGQEKEKKLDGVLGCLYDISWSPNNKYVTVNSGTSNIHETLIILVNDMDVLVKIESYDGPIWSPDSSKMIFAITNDKKPIIDVESSGTTDLMIYDLNLMREEIIMEATGEYLYSPVSWDENGISYIKTYLDGNGTEEEYIYGKNDTGIGEYKFDNQEYSLDENKLFMDIKFPQLIESSNKEIENKVNAIISARVEEYKNMYYQDEEEKQYIYVNYEITKSEQNILSMVFNVSFSIEGVAHPTNFVYGVSIDLSKGEELKLDNILKSNIDSIGMLNALLNEKIGQLDYQLLSEYKGIEEGQGFYLTEDSLIIYYQEGIYTPHAVGPLLLTITFDEINDILVIQ